MINVGLLLPALRLQLFENFIFELLWKTQKYLLSQNDFNFILFVLIFFYTKFLSHFQCFSVLFTIIFDKYISLPTITPIFLELNKMLTLCLLL